MGLAAAALLKGLELKRVIIALAGALLIAGKMAKKDAPRDDAWTRKYVAGAYAMK